MARILIVGYGNPLRSDDGVGVRAAERLLQGPLPPGTEVLPRHQLTPDLADAIQHSDLVIFVDAARGGIPGELRCAPVDAATQAAPFTHELTPSSLMSLVTVLYGISPPAFEVSMGGECFGLGDRLSPAVADALPDLVAFLGQKLGEQFQPAHHALA